MERNMGGGMNWTDYLMRLAHVAAEKSKDPSTKVGALIVDSNNRIISIGYNGPPRGTQDRDYPREVRLMRTLHAEENAILFARRDLTGYSIYTTHHPCAHCAAVIIQAGISRVFYPATNAAFSARWYEQMGEAQAMLYEAGVARVVV